MSRFIEKQVKQFFEIATIYFTNEYPNGASFEEIKQDEENALKNYLKFFTKNMDKGRDRYNSECNKSRNKWFALETIEKIMAVNSLEFAENLDFCKIDQERQVQMFSDKVNKEAYQSYLPEDDLSK